MNPYKIPEEISSIVSEPHPLNYIATSKLGIPLHSVKQIQDKLHFTNKEISSFLHLSESTFQRMQKKTDTILDADASEKTIELSELIKHGTEVFGDLNTFRAWLYENNFALGNQKPIDLLSSHIGLQYVNTILFRIDYGIYS